MTQRKTWQVNEADGSADDNARVNMKILGNPKWSPLIRYRIYMDHANGDHMTVWVVHRLSRFVGTYTPPGWFLKLIGQVEEDK